MLLHSLSSKLYLNKISKEMLGQTIAEPIKPLKLWSKYAIKKWLGLFRYVTTTWSWDCREAFPYKPSLHYCLYSCTVTPVGFWISLDFGVMIFILIASILQIMNFKIHKGAILTWATGPWDGLFFCPAPKVGAHFWLSLLIFFHLVY